MSGRLTRDQFTSAYSRWLTDNGYEPQSQYWIDSAFREYRQPTIFNYYFLQPYEEVELSKVKS